MSERNSIPGMIFTILFACVSVNWLVYFIFAHAFLPNAALAKTLWLVLTPVAIYLVYHFHYNLILLSTKASYFRDNLQKAGRGPISIFFRVYFGLHCLCLAMGVSFVYGVIVLPALPTRLYAVTPYEEVVMITNKRCDGYRRSSTYMDFASYDPRYTHTLRLNDFCMDQYYRGEVVVLNGRQWFAGAYVDSLSS